MKLFIWLRKIWLLLIYRLRKPGIKIIKTQLSGNENFIDIRYKLSRPDQANGLFPIYLLDKASGQKLYLMNIPKFGAIRTKHLNQQQSGILLFRNQNGIIKSGSKVTIMYGALGANDIEVN